MIHSCLKCPLFSTGLFIYCKINKINCVNKKDEVWSSNSIHCKKKNKKQKTTPPKTLIFQNMNLKQKVNKN